MLLSATTVATGIAHAEPTATAEILKAGIVEEALRSIGVGFPPCV